MKYSDCNEWEVCCLSEARQLHELHSLYLISRNAWCFSHQLYWESDFQYLLLFIFLSFYYWGYVLTWSWSGPTTQSLHLFSNNGKRQIQLLVSTQGLKLYVSTSSTGAENRIFNRGDARKTFQCLYFTKKILPRMTQWATGTQNALSELIALSYVFYPVKHENAIYLSNTSRIFIKTSKNN